PRHRRPRIPRSPRRPGAGRRHPGRRRRHPLHHPAAAAGVTEFAATPEGVGPHEDRELELMLAGTKPLAMFGDAVGSAQEAPEDAFAPYVADGAIIRREAVYRP